ESERLFYVAVTRAKERVYLSFNEEDRSKNSWLTKMKWPLELGEFPSEYYTYKIESGPWSVKPMVKNEARSQSVSSIARYPDLPKDALQNISVSRVLEIWDQSVKGISSAI